MLSVCSLEHQVRPENTQMSKKIILRNFIFYIQLSWQTDILLHTIPRMSLLGNIDQQQQQQRNKFVWLHSPRGYRHYSNHIWQNEHLIITHQFKISKLSEYKCSEKVFMTRSKRAKMKLINVVTFEHKVRTKSWEVPKINKTWLKSLR